MIHWLRPYWLLLFIPAVFMGYRSLQQLANRHNPWERVCDPALLPHILMKKPQQRRYWQVIRVISLWSLLIIALAGPSWIQSHPPGLQTATARVVALHLSPSLLSTDIKPSRLGRTQFALLDMLEQSYNDPVALVAYTGEPFVAAPLTADHAMIKNLVSTLNPKIMPVHGNRTDLALQQAKKILDNSNMGRGEILLMTDQMPNAKAISLAKQLAKSGIHTSVLSLRPTPTPSAFRELARAGGGKFRSLQTDVQLFPDLLTTNVNQAQRTNQTGLTWQDQGIFFLLAALGLALWSYWQDGEQLWQ